MGYFWRGSARSINMAELIDLDKNNKFVLWPLRYEQKEEFWFSSEVNLIHKREPLIKGYASFHINDFCQLIYDVKSLINNAKESFVFDPIEPYLKIVLSSVNSQYIADIYFCKGPIFEASKYKNIKITASKESLANFIDQIEVELKQIDSKFELKMVEL